MEKNKTAHKFFFFPNVIKLLYNYLTIIEVHYIFKYLIKL